MILREKDIDFKEIQKFLLNNSDGESVATQYWKSMSHQEKLVHIVSKYINHVHKGYWTEEETVFRLKHEDVITKVYNIITSSNK
jgi:hypothetical protein